MTTYIYAKAFYFEDEVKGPGHLPILDNGTFGAFQTEKPERGAGSSPPFSLAEPLRYTIFRIHINIFEGC